MTPTKTIAQTEWTVHDECKALTSIGGYERTDDRRNRRYEVTLRVYGIVEDDSLADHGNDALPSDRSLGVDDLGSVRRSPLVQAEKTYRGRSERHRMVAVRCLCQQNAKIERPYRLGRDDAYAFPPRWALTLTVTFKAERPSDLPSEEDARLYVAEVGIVDAFAASLAAEVANTQALAEATRKARTATHIHSEIRRIAREQAMERTNFTARLAGLNEELRRTEIAEVAKVAAQAMGEGVEGTDPALVALAAKAAKEDEVVTRMPGRRVPSGGYEQRITAKDIIENEAPGDKD